jgi:large subunit ribosomal protein L30
VTQDVSEDVTEVAKKPRGGKRVRPKTGAKMLTLHYVRSQICAPKDQKATVRGLGFTRLGQKIQRPDDPSIRGMVQHVRHLVVIEKD